MFSIVILLPTWREFRQLTKLISTGFVSHTMLTEPMGAAPRVATVDRACKPCPDSHAYIPHIIRARAATPHLTGGSVLNPTPPVSGWLLRVPSCCVHACMACSCIMHAMPMLPLCPRAQTSSRCGDRVRAFESGDATRMVLAALVSE